MTEVTTIEPPEVPSRPRRPHRRTRPLPEPEPAAAPVGQVLVAEAAAKALPAPELPQPPGYLVSIATTRRDTERRLLEREIERCDREIGSRTLQLRLNGAPVAEVQRVEAQLRQVRDERAQKIETAAALSSRELVLAYAADSEWAQAAARSV